MAHDDPSESPPPEVSLEGASQASTHPRECGAIVDEDSLEAWRDQVALDRNTVAKAKVILFALAALRQYNEHGHAFVEPIHSDIWPLIRLSKSDYYRHWSIVQESGYIEKVGHFDYKVGNQPHTGHRFVLIFP